MPQNIIKQSQKRKYRAWVILGKHKNTGEYVGIVEHSFSMGIDNKRIRVEKEWEVLYFLKNEDERRKKTNEYVNGWKQNITKYSKRYPEYTFNIFRAGSKNCPIKIDWESYHKDKKLKGNKFNTRNLLFKPK